MRLFLFKSELDGCSWYRIKQFISKIKNEIEIVEADVDKMSEKQLFEAIKLADVYYLRSNSPNAAKFIKDILTYYPHKKIIFDTDDDIFNVSPYNNAFAELGTTEVNLPDGKPLWVEDSHFDPYKNRKNLIDYEYCLRKATVVTVTTPKLADTVRKFNPNVAVIPNAVDLKLFPKLDIKKDDNIRLLFHGGSSHYADLRSVRGDLERLMKEYPNLHLYLIGNPFESIYMNMDKERVHTDHWINADGHGYRLASYNADIAICPLVEDEFNVNKSSIKFYENSALGIPTVAKNMLPYSADIAQNITGLLYSNDFYKQVKYLIDNPEKRKEMGEKAYEWVKENRNMDEVSKMFLLLIKSFEVKFVDL